MASISRDTARLVEDWPSKGLQCVSCLETRSVKYSYKGNYFCNSCVAFIYSFKDKHERRKHSG